MIAVFAHEASRDIPSDILLDNPQEYRVENLPRRLALEDSGRGERHEPHVADRFHHNAA